MNARVTKGFRWAKFVAVVLTALFVVRMGFALSLPNVGAMLALHLIQYLGGVIVFGVFAFVVGWLTGSKERPVVTAPPFPQQSTNLALSDTEVVAKQRREKWGDRLNGWQRLFALVSALALVVPGVIIYQEFPRTAHVERKVTTRILDEWTTANFHGYATAELVGSFESRHAEMAERILVLERMAINYASGKLNEFDEKLIKSGRTTPEALREEGSRMKAAVMEGRKTLDALGGDRAALVGKSLFIYWAAPLTALYLLSMTIAWVVRGFRSPPHTH